MRQKQAKGWSRSNAAFVGAFLVMGLATAHQIYHAIVHGISGDNMLARLAVEFIGLTITGAVTLWIIAEIRNRLLRTG